MSEAMSRHPMRKARASRPAALPDSVSVPVSDPLSDPGASPRARQPLACWRVGGLLALLALLLSGCPKDPLGADNRLALVALGQCQHAQALLLTERAIAVGSKHNVQQAQMLRAAILLDGGDRAGAESLYPAIDAAWEAARGKALTPARRARELRLFRDVARDQRISAGLPPDCGLPAADLADD